MSAPTDDDLTPASGPLPLEGLRVLDFSFLLPGPYCTQLLGDLGAEILKIEPVGGEPGRPAINGNFWYPANRNKQSVVVNLKTDEGRAVCHELAAVSDVVVEGFRPGTVERLGVDYATLSAINPAIVYCSMSGFGQSGPLRDEPGHDVNYLASGGGLAISGHWGEQPRRSGLPIADLGSGTMAALAIMAAVFGRAATGRGSYIDLALRDVCLSFASARSGLNFGARVQDQDHLLPMNEVFLTSDGQQIALGIVEDRFWNAFATAMHDAAPDLTGPDYSAPRDRRRNGDRLKARLAEVLVTETREYWLKLLVPADVPAQPVLTLEEALEHPQTTGRGLRQEVDGQRFMAFPALFDGVAMPVRGAAPAAGADTETALRRVLSWDAARIAELAASGAIASAVAEV